MNGLVVHPLLTMLLDDVEKIVLIQLLDRPVDTLQRLIHRHGANGHGRCLDDGCARLIQIDATGGEVHHGIGPVPNRQVQLLHLLLYIRGGGRGANVGIDLAA